MNEYFLRGQQTNGTNIVIFLIGHLKSAPFLLTIRPQNPFPASRRPFGPAESEAICENRH